jgi:hypothetical protein
MRALATALLAVLATGADPADPGNDLAVSLDSRPVAHSCAVASTATIVAYDATASREVRYRFIRSDGSTTAGRLSLGGTGAVARSVRDVWTPHGTAPWVALEIVAPQRLRSRRVAVAARCPQREVATSH